YHPAAGGVGPKMGGLFKTAVNYDPPHWDHQITLSYQTGRYTSHIFNKLLRAKQGEHINPYAFELEGDLAEKWKWVNPTTVIFSLRKGVKFHNKPPVNGRELTSADVKYTFERILSPELKSPVRSLYEVIKSIETPDRYTVKFILSEPYAPFTYYTALTFVSIIPKEVVEKFGDLKKWESMIGTGPFILEKNEPNVRVLFKRNPDYFEKGRPYLDGVEYRVIKSPEIMNTAVRNKELDIGITHPFPDYESTQEMLKVHPGMKMMEYHGNNWPYVTFATDKPPFNDKRVRQAFSMSFDRKKQLMTLYNGRGWIDSMIGVALRGSIPIEKLGESAQWFRYDPAKAKKLLREAGLTPPVKVKLLFCPVYGANFVSGLEVLASQIKNAGTFDIELVSQEYGAYVSATIIGKYDADGFYGLSTPTVDADHRLYIRFHSTGSANAARVKDPALDKLLDEQRGEINDKKRMEILKKLQIYTADQMYVMPVVVMPYYDMWFPYVKGYRQHVVPMMDWGVNFSQVWLDK
ncbi:MAG: ABC transporter substrate-binding protein, partial [Thermodesulfobacteriota bacterium]